MPAITPIPTSRLSNELIRSRLLTQLQVNQTDLFRVQQQISSGRRISVPSEDAPAAVRAASLQLLLERKTQVQTNLATSQSYLGATDSALGVVSDLLNDVRGAALSVVDTVSSEQQRDAVAAQVASVLGRLVEVGNQQFRGRYLFAGSRSHVQPFDFDGPYVRYNGDEGRLASYSDLNVLFESSLHGNEVFGAISDSVRGTADLNPVLAPDTRLADLRGGQGITGGSIVVSDGTNQSVVDLSGAETIGDVAALIKASPPESRTVTVRVLPNGLQLELDAGGAGALSISNFGDGTTASELGILIEPGVGAGVPFVGEDLDPRLRLTTRLDDAFGSRASAVLASAGPDNDLILTATTRGDALNDVSIQLVDDRALQAAPGLPAGNEVAEFDTAARNARTALSFAGANNDLILTANSTGADFNGVTVEVTSTSVGAPTASYDSANKVLTIDLEADGTSDANQVVAAIAGIPGTPFTATLDTSLEAANTGLGPIAAFSDAGFANTGNSGGDANTLYVRIAAGSSTANHIAAAINTEGTFTAELDDHDSSAAPVAGKGKVDVNAIAATSGGSGIEFDQDSGIQIASGGETYEISFAGAETVEDLLNLINASPAGALAEINAEGSGINVRSRTSGADFSVGENGGTTAAELGIRSFTAVTQLADLNHGRGVDTQTGTDFTITRNDGVQLEIDVSAALNIGDVVDAINNHAGNLDPNTAVVARLAEFGNGIELVDDNPNGVETLEVTATFGSAAAIDLGLVPVGQDTSDPGEAANAAVASADLTNPNSDLTFTATQSGTAFNGARIVIDNSAAFGDQVIVTYDGPSNTLTILVDPTATTANTVVTQVTAEGTFAAALDTTGGPNDGSGLVVDGGQVATADGGTAESLTGRDVNPQEVEGVFNSLIRLQQALEANDLVEVQRAIQSLDVDIEQIAFARAEAGIRGRGLDAQQARLAAEEIELRSALSQEIDVDFAEAISELTARQLALEASLRTSASLVQLSLLNFL